MLKETRGRKIKYIEIHQLEVGDEPLKYDEQKKHYIRQLIQKIQADTNKRFATAVYEDGNIYVERIS